MIASNRFRRLRRHPQLLSFALVSPFLGIALGLGEPADLPKVAAVIEQQFPDVRQIDPAELERELAAPESEQPVLIDVRSAEEYAVSHIEGAIRAETLVEARAVLDQADPDAPIVVYCAVGYRSAELARELEAAGYEGVRNLRGSIFSWANAGRPVVRNGRQVEQVHPYNKTWGKLLREDLRTEVPTTEQPAGPAS